MDPLKQRLSPFITFPFLGICLAFVIFLHFMVQNANGSHDDLFASSQQNYGSIGTSVTLTTNKGDIVIEFLDGHATTTIGNFIRLAENGFYNDTKFHRVIRGFMIQGGDPLSRGDNERVYGTGGPGYTFPDEINSIKLTKGTLAMANSGPNTNGSQFFIVTADATPWLDGKHTVFGRVIKGMDVVREIENVSTKERDIPLEPVVVTRVRIQ
ncbi:MAG: peptidylprolyl isomerase [Candidatus Paceibacterota bacterium]